MKKDNAIFLEHIIRAATEIEDFISALDEDSFLRDRKSQLAVIKEIEIMGEAAKRISLEFRQAHTSIPWSEMAAMRDKLTHGYMDVNYRIVWEVAINEIPKLKTAIEKLISK